VADSVPAAEYQETINKASALFKASRYGRAALPSLRALAAQIRVFRVGTAQVGISFGASASNMQGDTE
jgi:hypothetical protein